MPKTEKREKEERKKLWDILEEVEDPRSPLGRRYSLVSILRLMFSGFLCGQNNTAEVIRWAKKLSKKHKEALGFSTSIPSEGTLCNLFAKMDVAGMEKLLNEKTLEQAKDGKTLLHIAMDGKTIKGSAYNDVAAVHLLSCFAIGLKQTFRQQQQEPGDNEINTALKLMKGLNLEGVVVSGDAIFAQKKSAKK